MARPTIRSVQDICADCGAFDPNWASVNRGILICDECCSVHRSLGRHVSQVKSLKKGVWCSSQLTMVRDLYNNGANSIWEHTLLDPLTGKSGGRKKPSAKDALHPNKSEFIRAKHQNLAFINRSGAKEESEADISEQLHSSVRTPNLKTSLRLLAAGANPNYIHNEKYNSPLHMAAKSGQISQIELLIVYGANPLAIDVKGKTPIDYARESNFTDITERLIECQYELSDRLTYFLCGRMPDHRNGQHYLIPELADTLDHPEPAFEAKMKLHTLSNHLFEEITRDVYDEVDRREIDTIVSANQSHSSVGHNDRQIVPFLPVNHEFSAIRNQGRQKLARFNAREFATLIVDILSEIRHRVYGVSAAVTTKSVITPNKKDHQTLVKERPKSDNSDCDSEPLYDSVPSEDDEEISEKISKINKSVLPLDSLTRAQSSSPKEENKLKPVSTGEYCVLKDQLSRSDTLIQELVHSNKDMRHEITRLQIMVQKLIDENAQLRAVVIPKNNRNNICDSNSIASEGPPPAIVPRSKDKQQNRPQSMYERERPSPLTQPTPSSSSMASLNNIVPHGCSASITSHSHFISDNTNNISDYTDSGNNIDFEKSISRTKSTPSKDEVLRKTEQITRRIQELLSIAQEGKHDQFESCAEKIISAVNDMIIIFPETISNDDETFLALRQLHNSALHLRVDCRTPNLIPLQSPDHQDFRVLYHQVIQRAYDLAKAAKHLVTLFH